MTRDRSGTSRRRFLSAVGTTTAALAVTETVTARDPPEPADVATEAVATEPRVAYPNTITNLDPHRATGRGEMDIAFNCYDTLVQRSPDGTIVAGLATDVAMSADELTFTIRDDVTFHDGSELALSDVVYSVRRATMADVGPSRAVNDVPVSSVASQPDARKVTVSLADPTGWALAAFTESVQILPEDWAKAELSGSNPLAVNGTGAFRLVDAAGGRVLLERNPDYWGDGTGVETVEAFQAPSDQQANMLTDGTAHVGTDVGTDPANQFAADDDGPVSVPEVTSTGTMFAAMDNTTAPFDSQEFRLALNLAVDLEALNGAIYDGRGRPTGQVGTPAFDGYNDDVSPFAYDPTKAEALVERSGYTDQSLTLTVPRLGDGEYVTAGTIVAEFVDALPNVSCSVETVDFGEFYNRRRGGEAPFYLLAWYNFELDVGRLVDLALTGDSPFASYDGQELASQVADVNALSPQNRLGALATLNEDVHELAPWVFLLNPPRNLAFGPEVETSLRSDDHVDYAALAAGQADLSLVDLRVPDVDVRPGDSFDVTVTLENTGAASGSRTVEVQVDDSTVASREVTVAAGATTNVSLRVDSRATETLASGTHAVTVVVGEQTRSQSFEVVSETTAGAETTSDGDGEGGAGGEGGETDGETTAAPTDPDEETATETDAPAPDEDEEDGEEDDGDGATDSSPLDSVPGFGVTAALAGVAGALGVRRRRRDAD
jgi:peptide/nickel transport system substrate-binding protein